MSIDNSNPETGNQPFVLVVDQNKRRIEKRGYDKFLLGPVTEIDGETAEANAEYLKEVVQLSGSYDVSVLSNQEEIEKHSDVKRIPVMKMEDVDVAMAIVQQ